MNKAVNFLRTALFVLGLMKAASLVLRADANPRAVLPDAVIDLRTVQGAERVRGQWRYSDTRIDEIAHRGPGADLKASGAASRTYDFTPDAREAGFDDSGWEVIPADSLEQRRGRGRLSLNWYRIRLTIPAQAGSFKTAGSTVVFEIVVDDYAEVWVNGKASWVTGQSGGAVAAGWNAPNRVVLTRNARPGETFEVAVLGINGPISSHPDTYIWVRSATLDFYAPSKIVRAREVKLEVDRKDEALDEIVPPWVSLLKLADGFTFTEGPVWVPEGDGYLLFSDPDNNLIYRLTRDGEVHPFLTKSGYAGEDIGEYNQPGSNGLALDAEGRLTICQHGHRRVVRLEKNGRTTVLADRFDGRRLNSPNDLVYRSDGTLFFTDPPFGLPKFHDDPRRETPHSGIYSVREGRIALVSKDFAGPNGIALSPDEKYLYAGNWDEKKKVVNRYPVKPEGALGPGELFFDMTSADGHEGIDGIKVDQRGHVYVSGPGGLWILSPEGRHLGTLRGPEHIHNFAWGDGDWRSLYLAAQKGIYRLRLNIPGAGPAFKPVTGPSVAKN